MSLNGEADFHALEYRHNRVYGHDSQSGQILISTDKQTWDRRGAIRAIDLSVSPRNPDEMLVTTPQGLQRSHDAGATFIAVPGAPPLAYVSWPDTGALIGVDPNGTLSTSDDNGAHLARRPRAQREAPSPSCGGERTRVYRHPQGDLRVPRQRDHRRTTHRPGLTAQTHGGYEYRFECGGVADDCR